jgi:hypothetical protein
MILSNFEAVEKHFNKYFDDDEIVIYHEKETFNFHLDVYWIKPNTNRNYSILMTNGISSSPLKTPEEQFSKYIELCILLPPNWDLKNDNWKKPENYWPIKLIKDIGRYPLKNNTWLGFGHSIPTGKPIIETNFVSIILLKSKTLPNNFQIINCENDIIELYTIFPLYLEEENYKQQYGINKLLELFDNKKIVDIIDIKRENVCNDVCHYFA